MNKIVPSFDEAVADIFDGATILIGGFGARDGTPSYLIRALARQGARDLTIVANSMGYGKEGLKILAQVTYFRSPPNFDDIGLLVENGQVKKGITAFPVRPGIMTPFRKAVEAGEAEIELVPQGTLAERIRCAKAGIGAFYTSVGAGTVLGESKETRLINGKPHILEHSINADFALIRACKADRWGNLVYRGTSRTFNATMAGAAKVTIVEVNDVVELGELDPEVIVTPGIYVERVVPRPKENTSER